MLHLSSSQSGQGFLVLAQLLIRTGKEQDMNESGNTIPFFSCKTFGYDVCSGVAVLTD